jgi:hypothetical protein
MTSQKAFQDLIAAYLIEPVVETEGSKRYDLTDAGRVICDSVLHDVTKVALSLCDHHPDGQYGHDLALLIRGPFHLFLFAMSGQDGTVCAINNADLDELLTRALASATAAPAGAEQLPPKARFCGECGQPAAPGIRFCGYCGASLG